MTSMLDTALQYAEQGYRVLPCWPVRSGRCACGKPTCGNAAGKHPLSPLVPRGVKDASADPTVITGWWTQYTDANVAIATGEGSGIWVLDVDIKANGQETLRTLVGEQEFDPTLVAITGSGGRHYYFKHPGKAVKNSVGTIGPGIDVRGENGYVVAPPSTILAGDYSWLRQQGLTSAPPWLEEQVVNGSTTQFDPLEFTELLNGIPEGRRDVILFRWASKLRSVGVPIQMAEELVVQGASKCVPPMDPNVAREKVQRVYKHYHVEFELTDVGNAERLAYRHGQDLRYSSEGSWMVWDGQRWKKDPNTLLVVPYAQETVKSIRQEAMEIQGQDENVVEKRGAMLGHAAKSSQVDRLFAMLRIAQSDPAILIDPQTLDVDDYLLNCHNGTLNLRTGELHPHSQDDLITRLAGTPFVKDASAPLWEAFLERVQPDPEMRAFLQRAAGYTLTGSVAEQVMFFAHGIPRTGKSTFLGALKNVMGEYSMQGTPELLLADKGDSHPTALADLTGVRFVPTIEIERGKKLAGAQFKWLTGGDKLKARRMRQDYYEFDAHFKLWLGANDKPIVHGDDAGVWRRILLVPFLVEIPLEEKDGDLPDKLRHEMPGILNWVLEGCLAWQRDGLMPPESVKVATQEYRSDMDTLANFMDECTDPAPDEQVNADSLYITYRAWCKENGFSHPMTKIALTRSLRLRNQPEKQVGGRRIAWTGISLSVDGLRLRSSDFSGGPMDLLDTSNMFRPAEEA